MFDFVERLGVIGVRQGLPLPAGKNSVSRYQKLLLSSSHFSSNFLVYSYLKYYLNISSSAMTVTFYFIFRLLSSSAFKFCYGSNFLFYIRAIVVKCVYQYLVVCQSVQCSSMNSRIKCYDNSTWCVSGAGLFWVGHIFPAAEDPEDLGALDKAIDELCDIMPEYPEIDESFSEVPPSFYGTFMLVRLTEWN